MSNALTRMMEFRIHSESARSDPGYTHFMLRGIEPAAASAIASAIERQEGYYPGSLAYANNNPGNLVYVGQRGAVAGTGGFARFATYQDGRRAMEDQIVLNATRGYDVNGRPTTTLRELLTSWAPPSENNTGAYISNVSAATGFDPDAPLSSLLSGNFAYGVEAGNPAVSDFVNQISMPVDLSSVGISSPVPLYWVLGGSLFFLAAIRR